MMDKLFIKATKYSPEIRFDYSINTLNIVGESYPENTAAFYTPLFNWIDSYFDQSDKQRTKINLNLNNFNNSTAKILLDLLDILEEASKRGFPILINWIYDAKNEGMREFGEELSKDYQSLEFLLTSRNN